MKAKTLSKVMTAILTTVVSASILAGCGNKTQPSSTTQPAPQKEVELKFASFWVGKDSKAATMKEFIDKFNTENAGKIKITVEEIADYNAYEDKMKTTIATNSLPDLFVFKGGEVAKTYMKSGKLMDFTQYMNDGWKNDFVGNSLNEVTQDNKIMAVPYEYGVAPVMYNAKSLEQVGYKEFPKTYTEFYAMCDKLKAAGISPMSQMTGENGWTSMLWYSQLVVAIGGPDVYSRGLGDPAFLQAAKEMVKMYQYTTKDAVGAGAAVAAGHFLNERTAMLMNGPWFIGRIKNEGVNSMYNSVNIAPAPQYEGGKGQAGGYIGFVQSIIGAAKQTDKAKEAAVVKFLKFLAQKDNVSKLSQASGAMFVVKTDPAATVEKLQKQINEQIAKAPYVVSHFQLMVKPAVGTEFPQALSGLVSGTKTPEQFIEQLKKAEAK
jgi:raffinose/stachyose/melibiose transport system substrate-binding protein